MNRKAKVMVGTQVRVQQRHRGNMKSGQLALGLLLFVSVAASTAAVCDFYLCGWWAASGSPPPGLSVGIGGGETLATDTAGNLFFASLTLHSVFKLDPKGVLTRVAGNSKPGFSGDGGPATSAALGNPSSVAVDRAGNLYVADPRYRRIRKVSASGIIATIAGNGSPDAGGPLSSAAGPATDAHISVPSGVAVDGAGNLYIADPALNTIRKVSASGMITTIAGQWLLGFSGDGGPATEAKLSGPTGVSVDADGNLFIADRNNHRIRKVSPNGIISTVAGGGANFSVLGDDGPAIGASLASPFSVAVDGAGNLYIADSGHNRIRKVSTNGIITTVAGGGGLWRRREDLPLARTSEIRPAWPWTLRAIYSSPATSAFAESPQTESSPRLPAMAMLKPATAEMADPRQAPN